MLTLSSKASLANYQTALRSVTYRNTSDNPSAAVRTVSFRVNDGGLLSSIINRAIQINAVANAPSLSAIESAAVAYTENSTGVPLTSALTVADADSPTLANATVQITANYANGEDLLEFVNAGGITGSFNPANGMLTLSGNASLANYQTALRSVTYRNTRDSPSTAARTVSFQVNDGGLLSSIINRAIQINAVADAPSLSAIESAAVAYTESSAGVPLTSALT